MKKFLIGFCVLMLFSVNITFAADKKILYIPIDNRPCNLRQVIEVAETLDFEIISPPEEILGRDTKRVGEPEKIWEWLFENAVSADAAVISSDAMFYGSLVGSRMHNLSAEEIMNRAKRFENFHNKFPYLPVYILGTIMRTPTLTGSSAEPEYYKEYGGKIFDYTKLTDKAEIKKLSRSEKKYFDKLENEIPKVHLDDWLSRREKNFSANKYLIDLTRAGYFQYFLLGCDDNAPYSQTHLESRHLSDYGKDLGKTVFQVMSGADELGMLMVSRAINKNLDEIPFVAVNYNEGLGKNTVPKYSNEKIGTDISKSIIAAGAFEIPAPERADLVLLVNTNYNGKTFEANGSKNNKITPNRSTRSFMKILNGCLEKNYHVGVADISFSNGSDNALMNQLKKNNLQFKLTSYSGWNTATNSTGFLIGAGILTKFMNEHEKNSLLITRYLDDWAYQANVRQNISSIDEKIATELLKNFAIENINADIRNIRANFIWNRKFECDITFDY